MSDVILEDQKSSKLALYRGLIALAWADHQLHEDEKSTLHEIIESHRDLNDAQRAVLRDEIDQKITLGEVWDDIRDPQDRARLIDMANIIFQQDGEFSSDEQAVIDSFQARHLKSVGVDAIREDLSRFTEEQARQREIDREAYKAWASQYGLIGRIRAVFGKA